MIYYAAPMEGITGYIWRNAHHKYYPGITKYYTPFLSPKKKRGWSRRERDEILPEHNRNIILVPQILTNSVRDFVLTAEQLFDLGYPEVNLNLGCPSGTVVSKGKGSGFLKYPQELELFFERVFCEIEKNAVPVKISVKTRLGVEEASEFRRLIDIYNRFPLSEVIIHARVQKDMYKKPVRRDTFQEALRRCVHPVCYNGDIFTSEDENIFKKSFPNVKKVMLGRGLIACPQLHEICKSEGKVSLDMGRFKKYHDEVFKGYVSVMSGDRNVLFKMKELWTYMITMFPEGARSAKKIRKSHNLDAYLGAVEEIFASV